MDVCCRLANNESLMLCVPHTVHNVYNLLMDKRRRVIVYYSGELDQRVLCGGIWFTYVRRERASVRRQQSSSSSSSLSQAAADGRRPSLYHVVAYCRRDFCCGDCRRQQRRQRRGGVKRSVKTLTECQRGRSSQLRRQW